MAHEQLVEFPPVKPACWHRDFRADVAVNRIRPASGDPPKAFCVDVRIICTECGGELEFLGMAGGSHPTIPTVSFDRTEARLPAQMRRQA